MWLQCYVYQLLIAYLRLVLSKILGYYEKLLVKESSG